MNATIKNHIIKILKKLSIFLYYFYFLTGCNNHPENNIQTKSIDSTTTQITQDSTIISTINSGNNYYFEPDISEVIGTLKVEMFYGPPNFGDSPETDSKEYSYILYPDHTINVIQKSDKEQDFNFTTNDIVKFQLVPISDISLHSLVNKKIKVTGTFFGQHTGHHHTDVLLSVTKVEKN
jgi:hypothetical protein